MIAGDPSSAYIYVRFANMWRRGYRIFDFTNHELLSASRLTIGGQPALRIELGHVVPMGSGWMRERVLFVCVDRKDSGSSRTWFAANVCERRVTACTVMHGGRAVEVFHGAATIDEKTGAITVDGDRSSVGPSCRIH